MNLNIRVSKDSDVLKFLENLMPLFIECVSADDLRYEHDITVGGDMQYFKTSLGRICCTRILNPLRPSGQLPQIQ